MNVANPIDTIQDASWGEGRKLRIAQVPPLLESVPPKTYGGTERIVHYLTEALVQQGHRVKLFASGDSQTSAELCAIVPEALRHAENRDPLVWQAMQLAAVAREAAEFDIVHFHTDFQHFPLWRQIGIPQLTTLHGRLDLPDLPVIYSEFGDMAVVSISAAQRAPLPMARWAGTVYNGVPMQDYRFRNEPGDYLAFLGRFSPEKGAETAIEIAVKSNLPLKLAAKVNPVDEDYFNECVRPLLDHPLIDYIGEVDERGKNDLLGNALALLLPIVWPEPFGLVMIEAMACGTPVIAYRCGAVPEVVADGVTGFIVAELDEALHAVQRLDTIDRGECRRHFETRFTAERMAQEYLRVYQSLLLPDQTLNLAAGSEHD